MSATEPQVTATEPQAVAAEPQVAEPQALPPVATKHIVVLGASYAGIQATHHILRHTIPSLPNKASYHVTLVDPSTTWFNRVAAPRVLVSESALPLSKVLFPIADAFAQYPKESLTLIQGSASALDTSTRAVTISQADGTTTHLPYHALIIAVGSASPSPLLGVHGTHDTSVDAIKAFRETYPNATSIVIAGGGPAGVEVAGELGQALNGNAGMFSARPKTVKTRITLVTADKKLLPVLRPALALKAEKLLHRVGVDVVYNTRVESTLPEFAGRRAEELLSAAKVTLSDGTVLDADIYIPATGLKPNTAWLPKELLGDGGRVANDKHMRVGQAGARVYALGDVGSQGRGGVFELMGSLPVGLVNIDRDLKHDATRESASEETPAGKDNEFENKLSESQLVPVGKRKGVGAVFGWKLPGFMVWLIKGRDYMTRMSPGLTKGDNQKKPIKWKG